MVIPSPTTENTLYQNYKDIKKLDDEDDQPSEEELFQEVRKGSVLVGNKLLELEEKKDTSTSEKPSDLEDRNVVELKGGEDTSSIDKKGTNNAMK